MKAERLSRGRVTPFVSARIRTCGIRRIGGERNGFSPGEKSQAERRPPLNCNARLGGGGSHFVLFPLRVSVHAWLLRISALACLDTLDVRWLNRWNAIVS